MSSKEDQFARQAADWTEHAYAAVIDERFLSRHTLWHARGMARFVRKHPERLFAL